MGDLCLTDADLVNHLLTLFFFFLALHVPLTLSSTPPLSSLTFQSHQPQYCSITCDHGLGDDL